MPSWHPDDPRLREATDRVHRAIDRHAAEVVAEGKPVTVTDGEATNADPWLGRLLDRVVDRAVTGRWAWTCLHLAVEGPQPVVTAAWRQDLLTCMACAKAGAFDVHGEEDGRCDRCGKLSAGAIYQGVAAAGPVQVLYGCCPACYHAVDRAMLNALRHPPKKGDPRDGNGP